MRNKNDPLELHTKQVQKIFGAYSIHVHSSPLPSRARVSCGVVRACSLNMVVVGRQLLRELNEVVIFLEPSFLQEEMAFALGILKYGREPLVHKALGHSASLTFFLISFLFSFLFFQPGTDRLP